MLGKAIGVDIGTSSISIFQKNQGLLLKEPSVVAIDVETKEVVAYGTQAKEMFGKCPDKIKIVHPIRKGIIADFDLSDKLMNYFLKRTSIKRSFFKPKIVMSVPQEISGVEMSAFQEIGERMGARSTILVNGMKASALGAGMDMDKRKASMIIDIGHGQTNLAILSSNQIIKGISIDIAGEKFDKQIISYLKKKYHLLIGDATAEKIKIEGSSLFEKEKEVEVSGKDLITNLPHTITISSTDLKEAIQEDIYELIDIIKEVLEEIHPEVSGDIAKEGIILVGGSASLNGLDKLLSFELDIPVRVAADSATATIDGIGILLENVSKLEKDYEQKSA